jgi:hypothetical protein
MEVTYPESPIWFLRASAQSSLFMVAFGTAAATVELEDAE